MSDAILARKAEAAPAAPAKTAAANSFRSLRIGARDDPFEQEADRVADAIVAGGSNGPQWSLSRMNIDAPLRRQCACGGECADCKEKEVLRRKAAGAFGQRVAGAVSRGLKP